MFDNLKSQLYLKRGQLLFKGGISKGLVQPFGEEVYGKLSGIYMNGIPVSIHIKYLKPTTPPGQCYDRSLLLSLGFENPVLIKADLKDLEINYGKNCAWHCWIEEGDWVYDPTSLLKINKDLYYKINQPSKIEVLNKKELDNIEYLQHIRSTTLDDLRHSSNIRMNLLAPISLIKGIAEITGNKEFIFEFNKHLENINYDEVKISNQVNKRFENLILSKKFRHIK